MPQEVKEIDALKQEVLREHINTLKQITPPKESTGAFTLDRGYLDENNEATPLGAQYLLLRDNGLMDENGELTDEGRVYAKTQKEAVYGSPDDYIKREKLGLNQLDKDATKVGFGDSMLSMGKQFVTESIPAMFRFMSPTASLDPLQQINDASTLVKSSWLSLEPLATGAVNKVADLSLALSNADADEKETASLLLKQEYERKRYDYDSITGADFLTALSGGSTVPNQMRDILIKQKGEEYVTEQEQAIGLVGSFVDPSVPASMGSTLIAKSVGQTMMRSLLNAEKQALKFSVLSTEQAGIRSQMAALESALSRAEGVGAKVTEKASAFESVGKTAESVRYKATAARIGDSMQDIKGKLDELAEVDSKISTDLAGLSKKAGIGDALIGINNKIQQFNALPANVVGQTVEAIGNGLMKADAWLDDIATRTGIDGVYNTLKSIPGLSAGLVLGPAAAVPTIGARILASGPFLESVGKYTKILGKELMQARGSSSYWQRVANNPTISNAQRFLSHRMDELTLGGYLPELGANVAKGTAASYPMNLAIEYLQDPYGDTKDILSRAGGVSLVFGGGFSGVTQMFKGSKETLKSVRIADELNFTRNLLESQKAGFNSLGKGSRRMVSSFAAAFPNLNWDFVDGLPSRYDPVTNTVRINPKSNNPLRPLIAHEVGHYISIRNGANPLIHSMLLGDAETPGILRKTNGELDPEFQRFKDEYDRRTDAGNIERRSLEAIAEEYFIENTVDHMVEMVESGELSKMTGRTQAGRQLRKFIQATMPRVPILKDFFFRTGGAMQAGGKFVEGNGLLAEGLRELPEAKAMMRNLIRDTAGEASLVPRGKGEKGDAGNRLPVQKGDPIVDSFHSVLESDANGQPLLDKDGDHIPLSKATDEARQAAGLVLIEEQIRRVNDGYMPEDGEIKLIPDQGWQGRFISPATINALAAKGILNAKQIAILRNINTATRQNSGTRYMVINHPATIKRRGGKIRYASLEATLRETVPVGFSITKTGNILVHLMSVDQLHKNVTSRAASKRGQALYQGNTEAIKKDISAMMDMHATNTKTDKYYQDKYGPKWEEYQQFINTIFGQMTKEQRSINPMFDADKIKDGNVYRTFRLDRISKATKMDGTPIPFNYDYVKVNYFPDGVVEKSEQMPEQTRQMPEETITPSSERWKSMSNEEKDAYVFTPVEMTPSNRAEFDARVESGSLPADTPVVDINRSNLLTSRYGPPSSSATGNINTWIDDNTGKPVAVAFSENGNIPTKREQNQTPRYMPEQIDAEYMKAVESGDVEMQQRVVDEAAKASGYIEKGFHGTPNGDFTKFKSRGNGIFFAESKNIADTYTKSRGMWLSEGPNPKTVSALLKMENPMVIDAAGKRWDNIPFPGSQWKPKVYGNLPKNAINVNEAVRRAFEAGHDSVIIKNVMDSVDQSDYRKTNVKVVRSAEQIKSADPITRDDSGNIIPPSQRFNPESKDIRYMPEPLNPKTYENQKGYDTTEILKSKLDDQGKIILTKPTAPNGALTLLRDRRTVTKEIPIEARDKFLYDELAKVTLYKNDGKDVSFNYDPETQIKPVIKDAAVELAGKKVQIAMADRAMAALGDLGGILFPNLKVNQITFTGPDGIKYRPVWANMGWKPVLTMKVKAIQQGATHLLTYIMGKDAHASNLRTVRTVSNEIANAGLKKHHEDLFITLASYGDMLNNNASQTATIKKHSDNISELNDQLNKADKAKKIKIKKDIAKLKGLIKKAKAKIVTPPSEFKSLSSLIRDYRSKSTSFKNGTGSLANKNKSLASLEDYLQTSKFKNLASKYSGRQLIEISNSFEGRKAALDATTGFEIEGFSTDKVIDDIGEFKEATNNQVLGAVELSSNPDLFAIYLGDDPQQIKFMTATEKAAAKYFKEHPDFVRHESYSWVQLGPENGNNFLNSKPKKLIDYFKDFGDKYKEATGKYPKTENSTVGAMRDGLSVVLEMPEI